jgi:hypothetical protein
LEIKGHNTKLLVNPIFRKAELVLSMQDGTHWRPGCDLIAKMRMISAAVRRYRPLPYAGQMILFRARHMPLGAHPEACLGWRHASIVDLVIEEHPGFHGASILEPNVRQLAEKLRIILART